MGDDLDNLPRESEHARLERRPGVWGCQDADAMRGHGAAI
jgi:hypothetical protein